MKKWVFTLGVLIVLGFFGYKWALNYASDKVIEQVTNQVLSEEEVSQLLQDPQIQQSIKDQAGEIDLEQIQQQVNQTSKPQQTSNPSVETSQSSVAPAQPENKVIFTSKEEATSFMLSKFSMGELKDLALKSQGGFTAEEKAEIKSALLERLTPEEYEALKVIGIIELSKRQP